MKKEATLDRKEPLTNRNQSIITKVCGVSVSLNTMCVSQKV